jgi:hypothetical protein
MLTILKRMPRERKLLLALVIALAVAVFFGVRLTRRFSTRPEREPVRPWMSVPYVARSYGIPAPELYVALGVPVPERGSAPDRKPIGEFARDLGISPDAAVKLIEDRLAKEPLTKGPRPPPPTRTPRP